MYGSLCMDPYVTDIGMFKAKFKLCKIYKRYFFKRVYRTIFTHILVAFFFGGGGEGR